MENLTIVATSRTPGIDLNYETGTLTFRGRSMPENPRKFYKKSVKWVKEYVTNPNPPTTVNISYEYISTASSKSLIKILMILSILADNINDITFNWGYEEGDEDMLDMAADFEEILGIKFNFITEKF